MPSFQQLPTEIFLHVFECASFSEADLYKCIQVNRTWHDLLLPQLYRQVSVRRESQIMKIMNVLKKEKNSGHQSDLIQNLILPVLISRTIQQNHIIDIISLTFKSLRRIYLSSKTPVSYEKSSLQLYQEPTNQNIHVDKIENQLLKLIALNCKQLEQFYMEDNLAEPKFTRQDLENFLFYLIYFLGIKELGLYQCSTVDDKIMTSILNHQQEAPKLKKLILFNCGSDPISKDLVEKINQKFKLKSYLIKTTDSVFRK